MFVGNKVYKIKILVTQSFKYNFLPVLVSLLTLTTVVKIKEAKASRMIISITQRKKEKIN